VDSFSANQVLDFSTLARHGLVIETLDVGLSFLIAAIFSFDEDVMMGLMPAGRQRRSENMLTAN
jgi:hypothetical protein